MCQRCEHDSLMENVGKRVVCLASMDESTVLIYGHGVFEGSFFNENTPPPTEEEREQMRVSLVEWDSPEARRKRMMMGLVQSGGSMEAMTELAANMDAEEAKPLDQRISEWWEREHTGPRVRLDDGSVLYAGESTPLMFGPEDTFDEFVAGRMVMEVPYLAVTQDAASDTEASS